MELEFTKIKNKETSVATISLFGELGDQEGEINGHHWAHEFNWLDRNFDNINAHINGFGGSIGMGLSVVANIMGATSFVSTINVGVAASMAGIIALLGDKPKMYDYAKLMLHSPYYADENGEKVKNLSAKDQKALKALKDILVRLLMKRGKSEEEINKILKTDTWYSAEEALAEGFIDEIIVTGRKKELAALEPMALVAKLNDEYKPKKERKMKTVIAALGLPEDSNEQAVLEAVNNLQKDGGQSPDLSQAVDKLIDLGKAKGKVTEKNEKSIRKLADTDFNLFVDFLDLEGTPTGGEGGQTRITDVLAELRGQGGTGGEGKNKEKTFAWFEQNDPDALARMEISEPEKFRKLKEADDALYK
ncbi:ATP-dependent protease ClpP protease subunit [Marinifilum flexuosum]|uniref:ATP-dependent Clp protease proteolytic subunit n=2 Tax=Marinifilum flexuosum TaxID=1117708 RepID=A0A419X3N9_9BACT|nr:ATP-dependent protease ClpP protease subunit [Marinifilum flexuosum]